MKETIVLPEDYYLSNFQALVDFVATRYADLLNEPGQTLLNTFNCLDRDAQKLYVRLTGRKGPCFRADKLDYPEITDITMAAKTLEAAGLLAINPTLDCAELAGLLNRQELVQLFHDVLPPAAKTHKSALIAHLIDLNPPCPDLPFEIYQPCFVDARQTLLFLFFGNLHQDMTEFVLQDLGHTQYENYPLNTRLFDNPEQLATALTLARLSQQIKDPETKHTTDDLLILARQLPPADALHHPVLLRRRARLINHLARELERRGELHMALAWFDGSTLPPARERQARIRHKLGDDSAALACCQTIKEDPQSSLELAFAERFSQSLMGKKRQRPPSLPQVNVQLNDDGSRVEYQAAEFYRRQGWQVFYVENTLMTALVGLYFWDIIFADIDGAFFHPFQSAPADLMTPEFYYRREHLLKERLAAMQHEDVLARCLATFEQKQGIRNRLVNWPAIGRELINMSLSLINPEHLHGIFARLVFDIANNSSGFPDLILFAPDKRQYRWVEVKGPGDRLQENQKLWLNFFASQGIPFEITYVNWH